jgi:hypothetical protein
MRTTAPIGLHCWWLVARLTLPRIMEESPVNHQLGGFRGEGCLRSPHYSVIEDLVLWAS